MPIRVTGRDAQSVRSGLSQEEAGENPDRLKRVATGLSEHFRDPMVRHMATLGLAHADGEAVVQDVLPQLYSRLGRGWPRQNLRGWLFRAAHNLALVSRHRTSREVEAESGAGAQEAAVDPGPSPEGQVAATQHDRRPQLSPGGKTLRSAYDPSNGVSVVDTIASPKAMIPWKHTRAGIHPRSRRSPDLSGWLRGRKLARSSLTSFQRRILEPR